MKPGSNSTLLNPGINFFETNAEPFYEVFCSQNDENWALLGRYEKKQDEGPRIENSFYDLWFVFDGWFRWPINAFCMCHGFKNLRIRAGRSSSLVPILFLKLKMLLTKENTAVGLVKQSPLLLHIFKIKRKRHIIYYARTNRHKLFIILASSSVLFILSLSPGNKKKGPPLLFSFPPQKKN